MERSKALSVVYAMDTLIEHETQRLQQMRDNPNLGDPRDLLVNTFIKRQSPVTPHMLSMSVDLIVRNAALRAIGGCKNIADETDAKANIEAAKASFSGAEDQVVTEPKKVTKKKATK